MFRHRSRAIAGTHMDASRGRARVHASCAHPSRSVPRQVTVANVVMHSLSHVPDAACGVL